MEAKLKKTPKLKDNYGFRMFLGAFALAGSVSIGYPLLIAGGFLGGFMSVFVGHQFVFIALAGLLLINLWSCNKLAAEQLASYGEETFRREYRFSALASQIILAVLIAACVIAHTWYIG